MVSSTSTEASAPYAGKLSVPVQSMTKTIPAAMILLYFIFITFHLRWF
jgi:hypothetical protein